MTPKKKKRIENKEENSKDLEGLENLGIFPDDAETNEEYDGKEYWRDYC